MQNSRDSQLFDGVPPPDSGNARDTTLATASERRRAAPNRAELEAMSHNELVDYAEAAQQALHRFDRENEFISWEQQSNLALFSRIASIAHRLNTTKLETVVNIAVDEIAGHFKCGAAAFFAYNPESGQFDLVRASGDTADLADYGAREPFLSKLFIARNEPHLVNCNTERHSLEFEDGESLNSNIPENWFRIFKSRSLALPLQAQAGDDAELEPLGGIILGDAEKTLEERDVETALLFADLLSSSLFNVRLLEQLKSLAIIDPLTNVYNRRYFLEQLDAEMHLADRHGHDLCIVMIDIDYFKVFNDDYGHVYGDRVLREVAMVLKNGIRASGDMVARYGGEEFILLMPFTNLEAALEVAERLKNVIRSHRIAFEHTDVGVTCSFGVAQYVSGDDLEKFIDHADIALYRAKRNGRDRVVAATGY